MSMCNKSVPFNNIHQKISHDNYYWKLEKYTVDNIDSTDLINFGNYTHFKDRFLLALKESANSGMPSSICNRFYSLYVTLESNNSIFRVHTTTPINHAFYNSPTSDSCMNTNKQECQRNIFMPEGEVTDWKIKRLWGKRFVLHCRQSHEYCIEMITSK